MQIRKGAWDAIKTYADRSDGAIAQAEVYINKIAENGGTPLAVAVNKRVLGVIQLRRYY